MRHETWQRMDSCRRAKSPEEAERILVWHVFNGVMVTDTLQIWKNRFHAYWMPIPKGWITPEENTPKATDADTQRCILCVEKSGEVRMKGWYQVIPGGDVAAWMPCPEPPEDAKELRRKAW